MNRTHAVHPKLRTPLIQEALLEVRFKQPEKMPYVLVPGLLYELLQSSFPVIEELLPAQIPAEMAEHLVRHRFRAVNGAKMFQTGVGVLSVNDTSYVGFDEFLVDCRNVISAVDSIHLLPAISRLGLRYINTTPLDRPVEDIISIVVQAPSIISSQLVGQQAKLIVKQSNVGILMANITWPVIQENGSEPHVVIDLDMYSEPNRSMTVEEITDWVIEAHEFVYLVFKNSLQTNYFAALGAGGA